VGRFPLWRVHYRVALAATDLKRVELPCGAVLVSTYLDREGQAVNEALDLRAAEGVVIGLDMQMEKPWLIGPES
jgi:hypothetical protein